MHKLSQSLNIEKSNNDKIEGGGMDQMAAELVCLAYGFISF